VEVNVQHQLRQVGIEQKARRENVFYNIRDALAQANKALREAQIK
jgi:hypothetical protein